MLAEYEDGLSFRNFRVQVMISYFDLNTFCFCSLASSFVCFAEPLEGNFVVRKREKGTVLVLRMANRIWKEAKQQPGTAWPGNRLGSCLVSFQFLWAILSTSTVQWAWWMTSRDDVTLVGLLF